MKKPSFLIGIGQDSHKFIDIEQNKKLVLGGVEFDHLGLEGNSDADVLIHSAINAINQAIGKKSIGSFSDHMCKINGITDSSKYLKVSLKLMNQYGYNISNIGFSLECKTPKIDIISDQIKLSLSTILNLPLNLIGITATSGEELTSFGKGKGIQCFCSVLLSKKPTPFYKKPIFIVSLIIISVYLFSIMYLMNNLNSL